MSFAVDLGGGRSTTAIHYPAEKPRKILFVLAHGAGAGQKHPFMVATAKGLAARGIDVITFDFPYMHAKRGAPDKAPVLEQCFRTVIDASRSIEDVQTAIKHGFSVRLCKGIYDEPRSIAYKDFDTIRQNYILLLDELLRGGVYVGIATHDEFLIWHALRLIHQLEVPEDRYEFQMLLGVDEELRSILVEAGHKLRVYVPFGKDWYEYSTRRLKENPKIAGYVARDVIGGITARVKR